MIKLFSIQVISYQALSIKWKIRSLTYLIYPSPKAFDCSVRDNTTLNNSLSSYILSKGIRIIVKKYNINVVRCLPGDLQVIWRKRLHVTAEHSKLVSICWRKNNVNPQPARQTKLKLINPDRMRELILQCVSKDTNNGDIYNNYKILKDTSVKPELQMLSFPITINYMSPALTAATLHEDKFTILFLWSTKTKMENP